MIFRIRRKNRIKENIDFDKEIIFIGKKIKTRLFVG